MTHCHQNINKKHIAFYGTDTKSELHLCLLFSKHTFEYVMGAYMNCVYSQLQSADACTLYILQFIKQE